MSKDFKIDRIKMIKVSPTTTHFYFDPTLKQKKYCSIINDNVEYFDDMLKIECIKNEGKKYLEKFENYMKIWNERKLIEISMTRRAIFHDYMILVKVPHDEESSPVGDIRFVYNNHSDAMEWWNKFNEWVKCSGTYNATVEITTGHVVFVIKNYFSYFFPLEYIKIEF